ncbi:hypothetical protein [Salibacterium halotolerans]|uniref:Uncharacterized protein n=1 Tax=Salibacterium halotolerans TaxID=1884432 RepID=A0A1I5MN53_9BACI|nr:hypothetical protein [Salibacterium halotolerans]SFP11018.1 hypothetical protein SAMN05518683_102288 [Salibacterium halotolerans]
MVRLKDYLEEDLDTFFNTDEFAEEIDITHNKKTKRLTVIPDDDLLKRHALKEGKEGLAEDGLLIHVAKRDFVEAFGEPYHDQRLNLRKSLYTIIEYQEDHDVYTITLRRYSVI